MHFNLNLKKTISFFIVLFILILAFFACRKASGINDRQPLEKLNKIIDLGDVNVVKKYFLSKAVLSVQKLTCSADIVKINNELSKIKGVSSVNSFIDIPYGKAEIYFDGRVLADPAVIEKRISSKAKYPAKIIKIFPNEELLNEISNNNVLKEKYIVSVGGLNIPAADFNYEFEIARRKYREKYQKNTFDSAGFILEEENIQVQILMQFISDHLIMNDLNKAGFKIENSVINEEITKMVDSNSSTIDQAVSDSGFKKVYFLKKMGEQVLIKRYIDDIVLKNIPEDQRGSKFNEWFSVLKNNTDIKYYDPDLKLVLEKIYLITSCSDPRCNVKK